MRSVAIFVALVVGNSKAECPNACSGNGVCSAYDMCTCYRNHQGKLALRRPFNRPSHHEALSRLSLFSTINRSYPLS